MKPCAISNDALKFGAQTRITITKPVANKKVDFLKEGSRSWNTLLDERTAPRTAATDVPLRFGGTALEEWEHNNNNRIHYHLAIFLTTFVREH